MQRFFAGFCDHGQTHRGEAKTSKGNASEVSRPSRARPPIDAYRFVSPLAPSKNISRFRRTRRWLDIKGGSMWNLQAMHDWAARARISLDRKLFIMQQSFDYGLGGKIGTKLRHDKYQCSLPSQEASSGDTQQLVHQASQQACPHTKTIKEPSPEPPPANPCRSQGWGAVRPCGLKGL